MKNKYWQEQIKAGFYCHIQTAEMKGTCLSLKGLYIFKLYVSVIYSFGKHFTMLSNTYIHLLFFRSHFTALNL